MKEGIVLGTKRPERLLPSYGTACDRLNRIMPDVLQFFKIDSASGCNDINRNHVYNYLIESIIIS